MSALLPDPLAARARLSGGDPAFVGTAAGPALDYRGLEALAARLAGALVAAGIGAGDRVAVLAMNRVETFALLFACGRLGAILVPLNRRMPAAELAGIHADAAPRLTLADAAHLALARAVDADARPLDGFGDGAMPLPPTLWDRDRPWYLLYTSGTTAAPKGVIQTAGMALANLVNAVAATGLSAADTVLAALPLFHTAGLNLYALPALLIGARVVLLPEFDAAAVADALAAHRVSIAFAVPQAWERLFAVAGFTAPSRVRHWGSGGAPLPPGLLAVAARHGIALQNGMGMTETGPTALVMDRAAVATRPAAAGCAMPLCAVRILDDAGQEAAPGAQGEIAFAGPGITPGYWQRPEETAAAFTPDGWLRSGDIGTIDADGYVTIVGRAKDMFVSGGENVWPAEVEAVLVAHPAVADAAVVAVADARWGECGLAWIVPADPAAPPDRHALADWCRARLAPYKVPRDFLGIDALPRTSNGKLRRQDLPRPQGAVAA